MKKKIVAMCLVVALAVVAIGGATLAYFTDSDSKTNTFTTGKVDITLNDKEWVDENDEEKGLQDFTQKQKLVPAVVDEDNNVLNAIDKIVSVTNNTGSEEAYVRVHIAMPAALDGKVGIWCDDDAAKWNWDDGVDYTMTLNGVKYNVVCLTYSEKLAANAETGKVFKWVAMEPDVTNDDVKDFSTFNIEVFAEGCQTAGFSNAGDALDEAFGEAGTYNPWDSTDDTVALITNAGE